MTANETNVPASAPTAAEPAVRGDAVPLSEEQALDWLRAQPGGRVTASAAELGRLWGGWHRQRVGRRLDVWADEGLIKRRGDTVTAIATAGVTNAAPEGVTNGVPEGVTGGVTTSVTTRSVVPVPSRKLARSSTAASRIVRRALMPAETEAPIITFVPSEPSPVTVAEPRDAEPDPARVTIMPPEPRSLLPRLAALVLALAAIAIAIVGGLINAWYARSLGSTEVAGWLFLAVGVAADVAAFALPICAAGLWRNRQVGAAGMAWSLWLLTFAFAIMAGIGFASLNIADTTAGRRAIVATSTASADQRTAAIAAAQLAAAAATKAREAECAARGPRCRDREADERTALIALTTAIGAPMPAVVAIGVADPQTEAASKLAAWVSFGTLRPTGDDFSMLRLLLLALLPQIGGLLLMVSRSR